jgi:DNA mismatch repair protein MutL
MGRIRILSDNVANKIAAGEVVERPASVVKELLENSLDAGATDIRVEIENGGRRLIRVADNGCGMLRDDALLAFERHATSKLRDASDLLAIATLGFRGEALPSIASVSRLVLETRSADETTGTTVELAGGKIFRCEEAALMSGTIIAVRDLFFNMPARKKFLRSEQTELAHIASLVTHYSLAHPGKGFELRSGTNQLLDVTPVADQRERVYQVFGARTLEDLVELGSHERVLPVAPDPEGDDDDARQRVFALRGFISRPQVQKLNRNSIYLFVNGRLIRDKILLHALTAAYHNLIPPGCFPFALLFLDCDCEEVDVNVSPSKTEVRFRHGSFVHDFVRDTIRNQLMESRPVPSFTIPASPQPAALADFSEYSQALDQNSVAFEGVAEPQLVVPLAPEIISEEDPAQLPEIRLEVAPPSFDFGGDQTAGASKDPGLATPVRTRISGSHTAFPQGWTNTPDQGMHGLKDLRPLGQIDNSFIIAAGRDGLWIVDQHVAHERILFEKVLKQRSVGRVERQQLLMPIVLELSASQNLHYARIADELNAIGFETEPFGLRTIAIKAAPGDLRPGSIESVIYEILEIAESELRNLSVDDLRRGIAASIACQAAIKINTPLDTAKMDWLLTTLAATDYPMSCPHGRPVALRYSTREILKGFHRI